MAKTLAQLVKEYLAQPLQDEFGYKDIPDVTSTTKKEEEEETKKPIVYIPPSGDGGGGGIDSLNPFGGTPIQGGFDGGYGADPISGDLPGGGNIVDEFGTLGDVYAGTGINNIPSSGDLPGGGNLYDEFNQPGNSLSGGSGYGFSGAGPGVNPTTGDIVGGGNIVDEFGAPGFSSLGTGIAGADANDGFVGGQDFGADANDGFVGGQDFGADANDGFANDGFANDGFGDYSDFDDGTMTGSAGQGGDYGLGPSGLSAPGSQANSPGNPANQGGGSGDGCFIKGTLITMADGSTKPVEQVDLEDEVAVGGKVFAVGRFLNTELYDYKGIKVSGSHMVNEDGVWMRVRDTKHGKSLGDDKNTVYVFGSENRRILINKILFTDYFEVNEQDILIENSEDFFNNSKSYGKIIDKQNVDILNAS